MRLRAITIGLLLLTVITASLFFWLDQALIVVVMAEIIIIISPRTTTPPKKATVNFKLINRIKELRTEWGNPDDIDRFLFPRSDLKPYTPCLP